MPSTGTSRREDKQMKQNNHECKQIAFCKFHFLTNLPHVVRAPKVMGINASRLTSTSPALSPLSPASMKLDEEPLINSAPLLK